MNKSQAKRNLNTRISVDISEVLTQRTCAHIIIEIIKFLAYQKLQIPYSYDTLKYLVHKKREVDKGSPKSNESYQSANYFRVASTAVDVLETLFKNIISELEGPSPPAEVVVLLGALPMCPREAYSLRLPPARALSRHFHSTHHQLHHNLVLKSLRQLTFSQELLQTVHHPLAPTNMFVFLKHTSPLPCPSEFFLPTQHYQISHKIPQTFIHLDYDTSNITDNCCKDMKIFDEFSPDCPAPQSNNTSNVDTSDSGFKGSCDSSESRLKGSCGSSDSVNDEGTLQWFQADVTLKGFKDCCVNGKSVSDSWVKS